MQLFAKNAMTAFSCKSRLCNILPFLWLLVSFYAIQTQGQDEPTPFPSRFPTMNLDTPFPTLQPVSDPEPSESPTFISFPPTSSPFSPTPSPSTSTPSPTKTTPSSTNPTHSPTKSTDSPTKSTESPSLSPVTSSPPLESDSPTLSPLASSPTPNDTREYEVNSSFIPGPNPANKNEFMEKNGVAVVIGSIGGLVVLFALVILSVLRKRRKNQDSRRSNRLYIEKEDANNMQSFRGGNGTKNERYSRGTSKFSDAGSSNKAFMPHMNDTSTYGNNSNPRPSFASFNAPEVPMNTEYGNQENFGAPPYAKFATGAAPPRKGSKTVTYLTNFKDVDEFNDDLNAPPFPDANNQSKALPPPGLGFNL